MAKLKERIQEIIFEAETPEGKAFDVLILILIVSSVVAVCLESVSSIQARFGEELLIIEWVITLLFTIEYFLRIYSVQKPRRYIFSFYGLIDLFSILPTYLSIFLVGAQSLLVVRIFRLLRIFRIFKLGRYVGEAQTLKIALFRSTRKIIVFLGSVLSIAVFMGTVMYLVEGEDNGFTSIPKSIYWSIVTLTTVGFGDITPQTVLGQTIASALMILGYGILAVPTGIVSVELSQAHQEQQVMTFVCYECGAEGHHLEAKHCYNCGEKLLEHCDQGHIKSPE